MSYQAPVKDMLFCMTELAGLAQVATLPGFEDAGIDTAQAVLEECAKLNEGVIAPLNWEGDKNPSSWSDGQVTTTPGFKEAYRQYAEGGWQGLQHPTEFGGQGLPKIIGAACIEINNSANLSFALCPLLTDGAIEALLTAGSDDTQADLPAAHDLGRMDRHHEPDRAAGRYRPGAGAHARRAAGRRQLQGLRHQDLHHLWRPRHGRQHRAPGAGAGDRRARGREGHQPVRGAEVHGRRRRQPGRAQRRALRQHRAQARHQGQPDRGAAVR